MLVFGIILGLVYSFVCFYFATDLDKRIYYAGFTLDNKNLTKACIIVFLWPITWFFPNLWDINRFKQ